MFYAASSSLIARPRALQPTPVRQVFHSGLSNSLAFSSPITRDPRTAPLQPCPLRKPRSSPPPPPPSPNCPSANLPSPETAIITTTTTAETSGDDTENPMTNTEAATKNNEKPANHSTTTGSERLKPGEKRKSTEPKIMESKVKPASALEDNSNDSALEQTIHLQHSRAEPFKVSKTDLTTIRKFVYDKGLVGGSQPELLQELLAQLGVEEDDDDAILGKLKQKVSNVNRTRREFDEMVAEDDIQSVTERLVNIFKTFATRPGALGMVKKAIAQVAEFVETLCKAEDASSSQEQTDHVADPAGKIGPMSAMSSSTEEDIITTMRDRFGNEAPESHNKTKQSGKNTAGSAKNIKASSTCPETNVLKSVKPVEQRNLGEINVIGLTSQQHRASEGQARFRIGAAVPNAPKDNLNPEDVEDTVSMQGTRAEPSKVANGDLTTMRKFIFDRGLVGGSQPELLQQLFAELGVEETEEDAMIGKLKQKVSNINRTRREFYEMVAQDDIGSVKERLVNIFKTFAKRPGALGKVTEAIAEIEAFTRIM